MPSPSNEPHQRVVIIRRWIDLILYAAFASAVTLLILRPLLQPIGREWGRQTAALPLWLFIVLLVVLATGLFSALLPLRTLRWRHLIQMRYPAWVWSMPLALAACGVIVASTSTADEIDDWFFVMLIVVLGIVSSASLNARLETRVDDQPSGEQAAPPSPDASDRLLAWIDAPERPIEAEDDDLFNFAVPVAQRMARRLLYDEPACPTIGLVGPYGSGKTGVLNLLRDYLSGKIPFSPKFEASEPRRDQPRSFVVAKVGSWGRPTGISATTHVLNAALDALATHVDCLSLADLPRHYQAAIRAGGWWGNLLCGLTGSGDAEETLCRFDSVLQALDMHLLLVIEDLDRNQPDPTLFAQVQALLDRLKQSTQRIRFVIAIGNSDAKTHIDFAKLCDRYEPLPILPREVIEQTVNHVLKKTRAPYPSDIGWYGADGEDAGTLTRFRTPDGLFQLLSQPRSLRLALRHFRQPWPRLHGEVDAREAVLVATLRASSSAAFEFLLTNIEGLRGFLGASDKDKKKHGQRMVQGWDEAMKRVAPREKMAAAEVLQMLFPGWQAGTLAGDEHHPQSIRNGSHAGLQLWKQPAEWGPVVDYWQRLFAEEVIGRRDQVVARDMLNWIEQPEESVLPTKLTDEPGYASHFERLLPSTGQQKHPLYLNRQHLRRLTEQVHALVLKEDGSSANGDVDAVIALWRIATNRSVPDDHLKWVRKQVAAALETSLRFALDIERRWSDTKFGPDLQREVRHRMVRLVRKCVEERGIDTLVQVLNPAESNSLFQLMHYQYAGLPADWRWLVPHLIEAARRNPETVVPQLAGLIAKGGDRHPLDEETGMPGDVEQVVTLDEEYFNALFPEHDQRVAVMELIAADREYPQVKEFRYVVEQMPVQAKRWLAMAGSKA